jgi:hypothetical protein
VQLAWPTPLIPRACAHAPKALNAPAFVHTLLGLVPWPLLVALGGQAQNAARVTASRNASVEGCNRYRPSGALAADRADFERERWDRPILRATLARTAKEGGAPGSKRSMWLRRS